MGKRNVISQAESDRAKRLLEKLGSINQVAARLGITWRAAQRRIDGPTAVVEQPDEEPAQPVVLGQLHDIAQTAHDYSEPAGHPVRRFILTSAQNNTELFAPFWQNLLALAEHYDAAILVSRYTYNKSQFGRKSRKPGTSDPSDYDALWYAHEIEPYVCDERRKLAKGLTFCGELNLLPTLVDPVTGLESYTGRDSSILPHSKISLKSIPSGKNEATKFVYTTGTVTQRNYIQRREGQKADFHHGYGATLVEVDSDNDWFVRQLNADQHGMIWDLDVCVADGVVSTGNRIEAINWGDLHVAEKEEWVSNQCFGDGGMLDTLQPKYQFMHDVLDFKARDVFVRRYKAFHSKFRDWVEGYSSVEEEVNEVATYLSDACRTWVTTVVPNSNHNDMIFTWLQRDDFREDPTNAIYWLELNLACYQFYKRTPDTTINLFKVILEKAKKKLDLYLPSLVVLAEDESFIICPDANGGIECGMHGDDGPNGAKGSAAAFSRMGRKANIGHVHSAEIKEGLYVAGVTAKLDQRYNVGPSSWSHSHILTYPNGKRAIITMWNGKWRAEP